ncbi:MAG TPA: glycosyltransferase [Pyrinomonadaceae bacterium]|jgi:chlorobactene glucosyltransferase|nr:glycosyltransferase [Pyrinomonadaceae bacterium]
MTFGLSAPAEVLVGVAWAAVVLWLTGAFLTLRGIGRQKPLAPVSRFRLAEGDAPLVSILVPARNEERRILARAVRSMLAQDYEPLEIIAVNDRSIDDTGPILHSIARRDARLRVVEGAEPPRGWLGKPHALKQALDEARGSWILATDADMIFAPEALGTALRRALEMRLDAVTLIPRVECLTFWERVFMPAFGWFMMMGMPLERVNDPEKPEAIGVGGFFLIKRRVLERVGAFASVRDEVAEDLRMAEILKAAGARIRVEYAPDLTRTRMQTNFGEIWEGFTKNLFAGLKFSIWRALAGGTAILLFSVAPPIVALVCALLIAAGQGGELSKLLFVPALAVWLIQVVAFGAVNFISGVPVAYALTAPLGHAVFVAILFNSTARIATGSGVTWKGRKLYEREGVKPPSGSKPTTDLPFADE